MQKLPPLSELDSSSIKTLDFPNQHVVKIELHLIIEF